MISERVVQVSCELPASGGQPDFNTGAEKNFQRAAFATVAAGKAYFIAYGEDPMSARYRNWTTPVSCEQKNAGLYAAAAIFRSASGNGMNATTSCHSSLGTTRCDTQIHGPPPPLPPPQIACTGGQPMSDLVSVTTVMRYEVLTAEEAAGRNHPGLPLSRRPQEAELYLRLYSGLQ